jgi:hypothetical protein
MGLKENFKGHLEYIPGFRQYYIHVHPRSSLVLCQILFWIIFIFFQRRVGIQKRVMKSVFALKAQAELFLM